MYFITKNKHWLLLLPGVIGAAYMHLVNPLGLDIAANKAVAVAVLMIVWWIAEALPMPVVALVPLVLHPLLQMSTMDEVTKAYSNPVIFLFMGGFMLGLAIEKWNLHKRIALFIIQLTGTSGNKIILGFIIATGFLSTSLSNTATTMMMFPIALSVIMVMKQHELPGINIRNFSMVLMLVIAYASNIGGMSTIIGTPPNVAFVNFIEKKYSYTIAFADWMILCTPLAALLLAALYWVLARWMYPNHIKSSEQARSFIDHEIKALGKLSLAEKRVLIIFCITALLWITKDLLNALHLFKLDDSMIAILGAISLFATPSGFKKEDKPIMILEWADTSKMAWGILLIFGGGIALANSLEKAGVMNLIGNKLANFSTGNELVMVTMVVIISIFLSEVMSNVAQVIVLSPVLAALADAAHLDTLMLGIPMTLAASAASMMPMGTPPNAIVFSSGYIQLKDMMKAGLIMNIVSIILISLFCRYILPLVMSVVIK